MSLTVFLVILIFVYFLPSMIAYARHKRNADAIALLNLLLGWTIIGWAIALIWSVMIDAQKE